MLIADAKINSRVLLSIILCTHSNELLLHNRFIYAFNHLLYLIRHLLLNKRLIT